MRVDEETMELIRGPDGVCIPCKPGVFPVYTYSSVHVSVFDFEDKLILSISEIADGAE